MKYLEDPEEVYSMDICATLSRRGFEEYMPEAANFFKNFNLTDAQLNEQMGAVTEYGEEAGARKWYEANKELVDGWYTN